jgi:hypothetical protein
MASGEADRQGLFLRQAGQIADRGGVFGHELALSREMAEQNGGSLRLE